MNQKTGRHAHDRPKKCDMKRLDFISLFDLPPINMLK